MQFVRRVKKWRFSPSNLVHKLCIVCCTVVGAFCGAWSRLLFGHSSSSKSSPGPPTERRWLVTDTGIIQLDGFWVDAVHQWHLVPWLSLLLHLFQGNQLWTVDKNTMSAFSYNLPTSAERAVPGPLVVISLKMRSRRRWRWKNCDARMDRKD